MHGRNSTLGVIVAMITVGITIVENSILIQPAEGKLTPDKSEINAPITAEGKVVVNHEEQVVNAPIATSGNNIYIAWWTNKTGNDEVMFRVSTNNGATFGDKINLSNSTKADSQDVQIDSSGNRVYVTWWETNATSNEPVLRISNDNGKTFGPILKLAANGTTRGQ
jgi:hypothetical protein